ncbi:MAG: hypothetical protein RL560_21 [Actinomycetota bacterium]|jgi:hypothetical protein
MNAVQLKDIKKGEFFRVAGKNTVWVRGDFERSLKKYSATSFDDINRERFLKGATLVEVGFTF